ncbi:MAG: choice-of-anchor Q domain-containing protein, partial [Prochlorothrix sp.]
STVSGNLALDGGGIQNTANLSYAPIIIGTIGLTNTTVANNIATSGNGGGVNSGPGTALTLTNSLLANNLSGSLEAGDVIGNGGGFGFNLTLNGTNLVENGNITGTSLITGIDPQLSALGNYGGPTQTHLILPGSVAIDAGDNNSVMETTDQRGGSRITGTAVDLGAVEFQGADLSVTAGSGQSTVVNTNFATPITVSATETTFGNPLRGSVVTLSAPTTGPSATFASPSLTLDASGQGSTIATANTIAGLLTATATVGSNSASLTLTNLADAPSNLLILGGNNQSTIVNTAFSSPLSVQVTDQYGNPISGTLVAFNAPGSGASGQNTSLSITTDSRGTANTPYRANTVAGRYPVTSTVANTSLSTAFSLTNLADAPSILVVDNGNNQVATVESPFPNALTVRVTDQYGNPVAGVPVNFTVQLGATGATGFLNSTTGISDASGLVSTTLTANSEQGSFQVIATATGLDSSATFDLENIVFVETVCPPTCDDSIPNDNDESSDLSEPESEAPLLSTPNDVVTEVLDNATFAEIETTQIEEFSDYLDIPDPGPLTVEEAQNILRERDEETGTTTAYITSRFSPVTVPDPTTSRKLAPPSGSPTALSLANAGSLAVSPDLAITTPPDRGNKELDPLTPWIGQLPGGSSANPDDRLEVVVITATGEPEIKRIPVTRQQIIFLSQQMQQDLDKPIWVYKRRMQALYERIFAPLEADLQALGVDNLLLSLGDDLRGIPWGALYDGEQFLVEKYSVGV